MAWVSSPAASFAVMQVDALAPSPLSSSFDVAVLSSNLEGNSWNSTLTILDSHTHPWLPTSTTVLQDTASSVAWSADGSTVFVGSDSGDIVVLRRTACTNSKDSCLRLLATLRCHDDAVSCVAVSQSSQIFLASGGFDFRLVSRVLAYCIINSLYSPNLSTCVVWLSGTCLLFARHLSLCSLDTLLPSLRWPGHLRLPSHHRGCWRLPGARIARA
jgi:WD40 repeat protein